MKDEVIYDFLSSYDYDIRKTGNARWIDQKCAIDVVSIIADCVINYVTEKQDEEIVFTAKDIWDFPYSAEIIEDCFNKVHVLNTTARNEYDKFFAQPLELLAYSKVLNKDKQGNRNFYSINNFELLEYISISERFAYNFLVKYISKVLEDSNLLDSFDEFFTYQTQEQYKETKDNFVNFTIEYTPINNIVEVRRIFIKVLNPLACFNKSLGTYRGHISNEIISFPDLRYSNKNFRDIYANKPGNITRKEWEKTEEYKSILNVIEYKKNKAMRFLRGFNDKYRNGYTEVCDEHRGVGTQLHHIFPKSRFPELSYYYENIIVLTPDQHFLYAHPNNNTSEISISYQKTMLLEKSKRIDENISNEDIETIFSFDRLVEVLNKGFEKDYDVIDNSYKNTVSIINECYSEI
ncbi:MAG: restriction endonuclease [Bacilli bacterium]